MLKMGDFEFQHSYYSYKNACIFMDIRGDIKGI